MLKLKDRHYGIVVRSFEGDASKHQLSLRVGQPVIVKGTLGGWAKGSVYPDPHKRGFFPEDRVYFFNIKAVHKGKKIVIPIPGEEDTHDGTHHLNSFRSIRRRPTANALPSELKVLPADINPEKELMLSDTDPMGWWHDVLKTEGGKDLLDACSDWSSRIEAILKEENYALYSKIVEIQTRLFANLFNLAASPEQGSDRSDIIRRNQHKLIEEVNVALGEDVAVYIRKGEDTSGESDENTMGVVKLYRGLLEGQKRADEMAAELRVKTLKSRGRQTARGGNIFERLRFGAREQDTEEKQEDNDYSNLPEVNMQLVMDVMTASIAIDEKVELYFFLYSATNRQIISEKFLIRLPAVKPDSPKELKDLTDKLTKTIFKDVCAKDFTSNLWIVCQAFRRGPILKTKKSKDLDTKLAEHRRPHAMGLLHLGPAVVNSLVSGNEFTTVDPIQFYAVSKEESAYSTMHEQIVDSLSKGINPREQGIAEEISHKMTMKLSLYVGSLDGAIAREPELAKLSPTQIMSFPEVISPGDMRNDMYVTLRNTNLKNTKNVSVTARLFIDGKPVKCITPHVESFSSSSKLESPNGVSENDDIKRQQQQQECSVDEYTSAVYYHVRSPNFNETFRLSVDPKDFEKAVLVFFLSDHPSRRAVDVQPFGISYWKLTNESGLVPPESDSGAELTVYKYQKNIEQDLDSFITQAESRSNDRTRNSLVISHKLVSTRVTQNEHLKNLLDWEKAKSSNQQDNIVDSLRETLSKFLFMKTEEIKTFLREIFDSLFSILSFLDNEAIAGLVFKALNQTIGSLVSQKQLTEYRVILDKYIAHFFESTVAFKWIVSFVKDLVTNLGDIKKHKDLGETMKSLSYLFQFVVVSYTQFEHSELDRIRQIEDPNAQEEARVKFVQEQDQFHEDIHFIAQKLAELMKMESPTLILAQGNLVKFMGNLFDSIGQLLDSRTAGRVINQFIASIPLDDSKKNLIAGKLNTMGVIVKGQIFKNDIVRTIILPTIVSELQLHMSRNETEKRICVSIIQDLLHSMHVILKDAAESGAVDDEAAFEGLEEESAKVDGVESESKPVSNEKESEIENTEPETAHRPIEKPKPKPGDRIRRSVKDSVYKVFLLATQLRDELNRLIHGMDGIGKVIENLSKATSANKDIDPASKNAQEISKLQKELEINRVHRSEVVCCITSLLSMFHEYEVLEYHLEADELVAQGLRLKTLADLFAMQRILIYHSCIPSNWITFIRAMYASVLRLNKNVASYMCAHLAQENTFEFQTWNDYFRSLFRIVSSQDWTIETMSSYKRKKLTQDSALGDARVHALEILLSAWKKIEAHQMHFVPAIVNPIMKVFDIRSDKPLQSAALELYYCILQHEFSTSGTIEACEGVTQRCVVEATVDDRFKENFINGLKNKFEADKDMGPAGLELVRRLDDLMARVEEIQAFDDTEEEEKTSACIKVMHYFRSHGNLELYYTYAHTLSRMHANLKNYVEAAMALKLHADDLTWDSERELPFFSEEYPEQLESERKEALYRNIIDLFDRGKDWERAIEFNEELRNFLISTSQFEKLEELYTNEGRFYSSVWEKKRFFAEYFFVKFVGKGFSQTGSFIYRGAELERNMDFINRLKKHYPEAEISVKPLGPEYEEKEGQFIEVFTVFPSSQREFDNITPELHRKISPKISRYQRLNNVRMFTSTRRFRESKEKTDNEYKDMHREITFFFVEQTFPNIQRRQPITDVKVITLNPLLNAIKDIEDKNVDTFDCVVSHYIDKKPDTNELSMLLNGIIDAAVNGGIKKYLDAFFTREYFEANKSHGPLLARFYACLFQQIEILREGLALRRKFVTGKALGLSEHLEGLFTKMEQMLHEIPVSDFPGVNLSIPPKGIPVGSTTTTAVITNKQPAQKMSLLKKSETS